MSKKITFIISSIVLLFIGFILIYLFIIYPSYELSVSIPNGVVADLYQINDKGEYEKVASVEKNKNIKLHNGNYCLKPAEPKFSDTPECAIIDGKDAKISFDPDFSTDYLDETLTPQIANIHSVIKAKYAPIIDGYYIGDGQLFKKGEWYGTTLTEVTSSRYRGDTYRIILKKQGDIWSVAAYPQIVISSIDYSDIPFEVISAVNKLVSEY